jgi:type II secretory pathway component PulC
MNKKKIIGVVVLFILAAVIWRINLKYFGSIRQFKSVSSPIPEKMESLPDLVVKSDFEFIPLKRDPFNTILDTGPREPVMPRFSLVGIVIARGSALALMARSDSNVYTMKKGETYLGMKITDITPKQVMVDFSGKKETLTIWH